LTTGRMAAFSDGVIAVMVLELKVPAGSSADPTAWEPSSAPIPAYFVVLGFGVRQFHVLDVGTSFPSRRMTRVMENLILKVRQTGDDPL
ncbi:MAG TPA: hypothetical protein VGM27_21550, partial [Acidobacteriaceae bacterium]